MRKLRFGLLALAVAMTACGGEIVDEESAGDLPSDGFPPEILAPIEPEGGFYRGEPVVVYDLGPVNIRRNVDRDFAGGRVNPMYVFCDEVTPPSDPALDPTCRGPLWSVNETRYDVPLVEGQYPIVDEEPTSDTYSPFWALVFVAVGGGYSENDVKSAETMFLRDDFERHETGQIVHCAMIETPSLPQVPSGASGIVLVQIWYRTFLSECVLLEGGEFLVGERGLPPFETNVVEVGEYRDHSVPAVDAYFPEVRRWDEEVPVPGNILVDVAVDDPLGRYSPLVRVNEVRVLWDYVVGSFDDIADVDDSLIELRSPEEYRDLPILVGAGR